MPLKKDLKLLDIFSIASGAMISSGIFVLPGLAYAKAGPGVIFAYLFAGLLALIGAFSESELSSAMPKAGGTYFFATRSLGPGIGTINGMITWFSISLKSAFALVGMAAFLKILISLDIHLIAVVLCILFVILNLVGVKEAGRFQIYLVAFLLLLMVFYIVQGASHVKLENLAPFNPNGWQGIFSTAGFVFVSYGGLLKVSSVAEETKNPGRNIPLGMFLSLLVVGIIYTLVVFITTGVLGKALGHVPATGAPSLTPISDGAFAIMGQPGKIILSIAASLAFISTANAGIMAASRYPMALSRDSLLPAFLGKISKKSGTPVISILATGAFMVAALFLQLDFLVKAASTVILFTYVVSCISVIILRESRIQNYRPSFKAPLYPWIQIIGILGLIFLIIEMGSSALLTTAGLMFVGFLIYIFYGRARAKKEYALLHLIERITNKEFASRKLDKELKEILRERDQIETDRFDEVIENALVLDLDKEYNLDQVFNEIASAMSDRLGCADNKFLQLLEEREKESSTALNSFLAVPHIVIEGEKRFDIAIIRVKKGVAFNENAQNIKAIFVLAGTKDERNFHLRALSAIAQIVQSQKFLSDWEKAGHIEDLRDLVLLAKRQR